MIRYTVVWDADVEVPFTYSWIAGDARLRAILTNIANWVDTNLAEDAHVKGQALPEQSARVIEIPVPGTDAQISAIFRASPDDRMVRVTRFIFREP
jgi:hypothetical protein